MLKVHVLLSFDERVLKGLMPCPPPCLCLLLMAVAHHLSRPLQAVPPSVPRELFATQGSRACVCPGWDHCKVPLALLQLLGSLHQGTVGCLALPLLEPIPGHLYCPGCPPMCTGPPASCCARFASLLISWPSGLLGVLVYGWKQLMLGQEVRTVAWASALGPELLGDSHGSWGCRRTPGFGWEEAPSILSN